MDCQVNEKSSREWFPRVSLQGQNQDFSWKKALTPVNQSVLDFMGFSEILENSVAAPSQRESCISSWNVLVSHKTRIPCITGRFTGREGRAPFSQSTFYRLPRKVREGNVFRSICHSVHKEESLSSGQRPPWTETPLKLTSSGSHCSGWYTSY